MHRSIAFLSVLLPSLSPFSSPSSLPPFPMSSRSLYPLLPSFLSSSPLSLLLRTIKDCRSLHPSSLRIYGAEITPSGSSPSVTSRQEEKCEGGKEGGVLRLYGFCKPRWVGRDGGRGGGQEEWRDDMVVFHFSLAFFIPSLLPSSIHLPFSPFYSTEAESPDDILQGMEQR